MHGGSVWRWLTARGSPTDMPGWIYLVQLVWAAVLLGVLLAYVHGGDRLDLPPSFGNVPVEAPWLGAVGGLLASFGGIVRHNHKEWEPRFNYWHPIKPLMGAASGAAACLLVIVVARTAATGSASIHIDSTALDGAAFVFGYAESAFRQLIESVTDVFVRPGTARPSDNRGSDTKHAAEALGGEVFTKPSTLPEPAATSTPAQPASSVG